MGFDYESAETGGNLILDMRTTANWARMIVALFTMAVLCASVCSASCATGICPNQVQQTAGHDCGQTSPQHSQHSGQHAPDNPDCSQHQHPGLIVTKSGNLSQFHLTLVGHANASDIAVVPLHALVGSFTHAQAGHHAPRLESSAPLFRQISVLRI